MWKAKPVHASHFGNESGSVAIADQCIVFERYRQALLQTETALRLVCEMPQSCSLLQSRAGSSGVKSVFLEFDAHFSFALFFAGVESRL